MLSVKGGRISMFLAVMLAISIFLIVFLCFAIEKIVRYADTMFCKLDRYREYFALLNQWLLLKQNNLSISDYLIEKGYTKVAIYGMGSIGVRLCEDLRNTKVHIERTIDREANTIYHPLGVLKPNIGLADLEVDVVIITVNAVDVGELKSYMTDKEIPLLKLDDIIYSI